MTLLRIVIKCNILIKVNGNTPSTSLAIIRDNSLVIIVAKWIIVYSIISLFIFLNEIFINSFFYFGSTYLQQLNSTSLIFIIQINLMSSNDSKRVIIFPSRLFLNWNFYYRHHPKDGSRMRKLSPENCALFEGL